LTDILLGGGLKRQNHPERLANLVLISTRASSRGTIFSVSSPMAGIGAHRQQLEAVRNDGYKGFVFS
jgi:hypothetical protein